VIGIDVVSPRFPDISVQPQIAVKKETEMDPTFNISLIYLPRVFIELNFKVYKLFRFHHVTKQDDVLSC